jgi:hypothetical protein
MKAFKWIVLLLVLGGLGYLAWQIFSPYSKTEPLNAISADAVFIVETNNLFDAWDKLTTNKAWVNLKNQPIFAKLGKGVAMIDTIIQSNRHLSEFIGHRKVYVSLYTTGAGKYDLAYIIDLRRLSKILSVKDFIGSFSTSSLNITKLKGTDADIFQVEMKSTKQVFYCYFVDNLFVGSFSRSIILKSIATTTDKSIGKDPFFTEMVDKTSGGGIFRLYVNYARMDDYLRGMLVKLDENTKSFTRSLRYSGLTFDISRDGSISFDGYTMINDSVNSSLKAVISSGMGNSSIESVLPVGFSSSVSLCFSRFTDYFDNMQETLDQTEYSYKNYQQEIATLENYLGIKVRENFFNWIGDEVSLVQMAPMGLGKNNEFAVFLKMRSKNEAQENLEFIEKRIKNRTPVKIENIDYKGFPINYLAVKGFFKLLLGKYFQKLETPYYTFVGDYVVLSNHPQVLKKVIDSQADESYIEKDDVFSDFYSAFGRKSNGLLLVKTENLLNSMKYDLKPQTQQQMEVNKNNFLSYPYLGLQLSKEGNYFKTRFLAYYNVNEENMEQAEEEAVADSLSADSVKTLVNLWVNDADAYLIVDVKQQLFIETFPDGNKKVEMEVRDGFRDGKYREYYQNGELKVKGEYKNDKKNSTWKFYNENGKLIYKAEFENGERKE